MRRTRWAVRFYHAFSRTLSTKGQLTIPKGVLAKHGVDAGDSVAFEPVPEGVAARFVPRDRVIDYLLESLAAASQRLLARRREGTLDLTQPDAAEDLATIGDVLEHLKRRRAPHGHEHTTR